MLPAALSLLLVTWVVSAHRLLKATRAAGPVGSTRVSSRLTSGRLAA